MRTSVGILVVFLLASPVWAQPATETTATVEHIFVDYPDREVEQKFLVLPDGTYVRVKGVNTLRHDQKVKVKKAKVRKLEKANKEPVLTEAEVDSADITPESTPGPVAENINPDLPAPRVLKVDVILPYWSDAPQSWQLGYQAAFNAFNAKWQAMSFWSQSWQAKFHLVKIAAPSSASCNYEGVRDAARAAITASGGTMLGGYLVTAMQHYSACGGWSGLAQVGGGSLWLNGSFRSWVHEAGHNGFDRRGLGHSGFYSQNGTSGQLHAYGDDCDPMGQSGTICDFGPDGKRIFQWIAPLVVTTGTHTLDCFEGVTPGVKALQIPSTQTVNYFVNYPCVMGGGQVRVHSNSTLFDMEPNSSVDDRVLDVGQSYTLPTGQTLTPLSRSATSATVRVSPGTRKPPSRPTSVRVEPTL